MRISGLKNVVRALMAALGFLIVAVIPWEIVLGVFLLSWWSYDEGWRRLGAFFKILDVILAVATTVWMTCFFVIWFMYIARAVRDWIRGKG